MTVKSSDMSRMKLGDCATFINGRAYKQDELLSAGKYKVIRIQNLNKGKFWYFSDLELDEGKYCQRGDLLFAWSATFGPYYWCDEQAIYHYHIWKVVPNTKFLDKAFAYYLLLWITGSIKNKAHGIAMLHVTKSGMENYLVDIPPIETQKVIAHKLDLQLSEIRKNLQSTEEQLTDTHLLATRQKEVVQHWLSSTSTVLLGDLLHGIEAGKSLKTLELPARPDQPAILKVSAVSWKEFKPQEAKLIDSDYQPDERHRVKKGDLIISRANTLELVGATVFVESDYPQRLLSDKTLRLVLDQKKVLPEFVLQVLRLSEAREHIESNATGSSDSMRNISQKTIRSIPIPLPDMKLQQEVVDLMKQSSKSTRDAELALRTMQADLDTLSNKLITQTFENL